MVVHYLNLSSIARCILAPVVMMLPLLVSASGGTDPDRVPVRSSVAPAPASQSAADAHLKSEGCVTCHTDSDAKTMHVSPAVQLGCIDCHGGDATVAKEASMEIGSAEYQQVIANAHPVPHYKET